ncbi:MAG: hypothetical protein M1827_002966 [Pycnora praestabilis]|nr:MAG: hypothetical protein M1827_002966 [Pycnora praestabilis]
MNATRILRQVAAAPGQHRTPLIKFLGKRSTPESMDHAPHAHPASPTHDLPDSFASYRQKAQQHGPLNHRSQFSTSGGAIGGQPGSSLGPIEPPQGQYFDRDDLPTRFRRTIWTQAEIDAIDSGGASMFA